MQLTLPAGIPAYLLGTAFLGLGLQGLRAPETAYATFGLPAPPPPPKPEHPGNITTRATILTPQQAARAAASPFVHAKAARDLTFGILYLVFQYQGDERAVNTLMAAMTLVGGLDGTIVWVFGGEELRDKAWAHWAGSVALGAWAVTRIMGYGP
jgi:hypothetical protein